MSNLSKEQLLLIAFTLLLLTGLWPQPWYHNALGLAHAIGLPLPYWTGIHTDVIGTTIDFTTNTVVSSEEKIVSADIVVAIFFSSIGMAIDIIFWFLIIFILQKVVKILLHS
jgi:hypothetical protein